MIIAQKTYNADELLYQMRNDPESDWVDRLIEAIANVPDPRATLTARQADCLRCAAEGLRDHKAAEKLGISTYTVKQHWKEAIELLGAHGLTNAVAIAIRRGLL